MALIGRLRPCDPLYELCRALLYQAVDDMQLYPPSHPYYQEALGWFRGEVLDTPNLSYELICFVLGIDPEAFIETLTKKGIKGFSKSRT